MRAHAHAAPEGLPRGPPLALSLRHKGGKVQTKTTWSNCSRIPRNVRPPCRPQRRFLPHRERALFWSCQLVPIKKAGPQSQTLGLTCDNHPASVSALLLCAVCPSISSATRRMREGRAGRLQTLQLGKGRQQGQHQRQLPGWFPSKTARLAAPSLVSCCAKTASVFSLTVSVITKALLLRSPEQSVVLQHLV